MGQQVINLTEKQVVKLTQIQAQKQLLNERESEIVELILDNAGVKLPVGSVRMDKNTIIVEWPDEDSEEQKGKE